MLPLHLTRLVNNIDKNDVKTGRNQGEYRAKTINTPSEDRQSIDKVSIKHRQLIDRKYQGAPIHNY